MTPHARFSDATQAVVPAGRAAVDPSALLFAWMPATTAQSPAARQAATDEPFRRTIEAWLARCPSPIMADLLAATGLSPRQLERKCRAIYGKPPRLLATQNRALRAAAAMAAQPEADHDTVTFGFYDQSHMIRDVKRFTGLTPGQIRAGQYIRRPQGSAGRANEWASSAPGDSGKTELRADPG